MIKKLLSLIILFLIIPTVMSANYGEDGFGCGLFGIGCEREVEEEEVGVEEQVTGAGASGSAGARGGGCDVYADQYKVCYHIGEYGGCEEGCEEGYYCDDDYRCELGKLVIKTVTETILETTGSKKAVIFSLLLLSIMLLGFIGEVRKLKHKGKKETERIIKEASSKVYEKEG